MYPEQFHKKIVFPNQGRSPTDRSSKLFSPDPPRPLRTATELGVTSCDEAILLAPYVFSGIMLQN